MTFTIEWSSVLWVGSYVLAAGIGWVIGVVMVAPRWR